MGENILIFFYAFLNLRFWIMFSSSLHLFFFHYTLKHVYCSSFIFSVFSRKISSFFSTFIFDHKCPWGFLLLRIVWMLSFRIKTRLGLNYQSDNSNSSIKYQIFFHLSTSFRPNFNFFFVKITAGETMIMILKNIPILSIHKNWVLSLTNLLCFCLSVFTWYKLWN